MNTELKLHKKTFGELTLDELYELLRAKAPIVNGYPIVLYRWYEYFLYML